MERAFERTVEQPAYQAKGEDIAAFEHTFVVESAVGKRLLCQGGYGHLHHLSLDAKLLERLVGGVQRLAQIRFLERIYIHYYHASGIDMVVILLKRGRIHGYQHIAVVAGVCAPCCRHSPGSR